MVTRMKIDVKQIFIDYVRTLRGSRWTLLSILDAALLFGAPLLAAFLSFYFKKSLDESLFLSLFTLFGVFIAVFMAILNINKKM